MIIEKYHATKIFVEATDTSYDLYEALGEFQASSPVRIEGNAIVVEESA